jgi:hypothetical protein
MATRARENADGARLDAVNRTADNATVALKAPLASPVLVTPNLGTPSAGVMTNATGIPAAQVSGVLPSGVTGGSGLTALGTVTAGTLGASVVNNISMIGFSGSVSGSTTYTSSVVMVFDTNVVNNGMTIMTGGDAGKIKVVTAGKYFITALAYTQHNSNSTYYAGIEIRDGGSIIAGSGATGYTADSTRLSISTHIIHAFSADDEIHISSLISGDSIFGGLNTRLSILYLGQ